MTLPTINCGDLVYDVDPRHIGRVEALLWGHGPERKVRIVWVETGWISELAVRRLRIVEKTKDEIDREVIS